ncbi:hypothetical protein E2C01_069284 [Portunus trituberculatus]|uniref:Uncharacterized protein n=1 Tax=Portunus trituberculatus TaxID=210409 RepID=A0A5B7I2D4_PORTR|nr:hypothetical protein [Portunus trituberculatus]
MDIHSGISLLSTCLSLMLFLHHVVIFAYAPPSPRYLTPLSDASPLVPGKVCVSEKSITYSLLESPGAKHTLEEWRCEAKISLVWLVSNVCVT